MIKIEESGEPLVDLKKFCPDLIIDLDPARIKTEKSALLRKNVAQKLCQAKKYLPKGYTFIIGDAWRPQKFQKKYFQDLVKKFTKKYPRWTREKIRQEAKKYVASASGKLASGHLTGGAVDLRLWKKDRKVPMKSSKLSYQENAKSIQAKLPKYIQKNRRLLFSALKKAGLSNNPREYWHWSRGDIWWAKRENKKIAIYGVIEKN